MAGNETDKTKRLPDRDDMPPKPCPPHPSPGGRRRRRERTKKEDGAYLLPTKQKSMKDFFPVRRSARKCKSALEDEKFQAIVERLKSANEDGLKAVEVEGKGRGVVSTRPFSKDELVCEYSGELISHKVAKRREARYSMDPKIGCYMYYFQFKTKKLCVDATRDNGRLGRLLNHSKTAANVATKLVEVEGEPFLCLVASKEVPAGQELLYDYGERSSEAVQSHPWLAS